MLSELDFDSIDKSLLDSLLENYKSAINRFFFNNFAALKIETHKKGFYPNNNTGELPIIESTYKLVDSIVILLSYNQYGSKYIFLSEVKDSILNSKLSSKNFRKFKHAARCFKLDCESTLYTLCSLSEMEETKVSITRITNPEEIINLFPNVTALNRINRLSSKCF